MIPIKEKLYILRNGALPVIFFALLSGLYAQNETNAKPQSEAKTDYEFPAGNYWSLDAGFGMSGTLVEGSSFNFIIDPKLWLSPPLMVGAKSGVSISKEKNSVGSELGNIVTFEGQVYMRWNFLRLGQNLDKRTNIFAQLGVGLLAAYRGTKNPFNEVTETRGSLLVDLALGATIPLGTRWHLEPQVRVGYPHIWGFALLGGYKFPLPMNKYISEKSTEYIEVEKMLPASEIIKRITITAVEFVIFGPDIGSYNVGIDRDAQQLNELLLNSTAKMLSEHPDYRVRIEGHANPFTINRSEAEELLALSTMRAYVVAEQLRARGVKDEQMNIIAFGGTRNATSDWDVRNRNRRVEIMIMHINED